ncbi:MAG: hypothetical protein RMA76_43650 [Deltaproteobacteria bacterium]|jgi:hypothetical protein
MSRRDRALRWVARAARRTADLAERAVREPAPPPPPPRPATPEDWAAHVAARTGPPADWLARIERAGLDPTEWMPAAPDGVEAAPDDGPDGVAQRIADLAPNIASDGVLARAVALVLGVARGLEPEDPLVSDRGVKAPRVGERGASRRGSGEARPGTSAAVDGPQDAGAAGRVTSGQVKARGSRAERVGIGGGLGDARSGGAPAELRGFPRRAPGSGAASRADEVAPEPRAPIRGAPTGEAIAPSARRERRTDASPLGGAESGAPATEAPPAESRDTVAADDGPLASRPTARPVARGDSIEGPPRNEALARVVGDDDAKPIGSARGDFGARVRPGADDGVTSPRVAETARRERDGLGRDQRARDQRARYLRERDQPRSDERDAAGTSASQASARRVKTTAVARAPWADASGSDATPQSDASRHPKDHGPPSADRPSYAPLDLSGAASPWPALPSEGARDDTNDGWLPLREAPPEPDAALTRLEARTTDAARRREQEGRAWSG